MRRSGSAVAVLIAGAIALVGPAAAEWSALAALRDGIARCTDAPPHPTCGGLARADVDLDGLRLWSPWHARAGLHVEADDIAVGLGPAGLTVDTHGLRVRRDRDRDRDASRPRTSSETPPPDELAASTSPPRPRRRPLDTRGVPVHVRAHGSSSWSHAGVTVRLLDPQLELDGHGAATARFGLEVHGHGVDVRSEGRFVARALDGDPRRWRAEGPLRVGASPVVSADLTISERGLDASIDDPSGGRLSLRVPSTNDPPGGTLTLNARRFALEHLGPLVERARERWGVDLSAARLDGTASTSRGNAAASRGSLHVDHLVLDGVVLDQPKLARSTVHLDALGLEGRLTWQGPHQLDGEGWVTHRGARLRLSGRRSEEALDLYAALEPLRCQALLDALPAAMSEMVAGTQLAGDIEGHAALHVDRAALRRARQHVDRRPDAPGPGTLELSFPFLERCAVTQDDPRLDLTALAGPYRHRFVDHDGREQRRVLAPGAPGFASLHEVPLLSRAFVSREDRRFWRHDGFDREQMRNALWHNVVRGRVSRGASTISQQAARNLWLGVDRSWGRKLQEALLTARLESSIDKTRIMELYLNIIELGPGVHGVDDAARFYFGRPASRLSVLQAVHLASLAPAPNRFAARFVDGTVDAEWLDDLRGTVRRMHRAGFISRRAMQDAMRDDLRLLDRRPSAPG